MSTRNYLRAPNYSSFSAYLYIFKVRPHGSRTYIHSHTNRPPRHPSTITTTTSRRQEPSYNRARHTTPAHPVATPYTYRRAGPTSYTLHPIILLPLVPIKDGQQGNNPHPHPIYIPPIHPYTQTQYPSRYPNTPKYPLNFSQKHPKPANLPDSKCHIPSPNRSKKIGA